MGTLKNKHTFALYVHKTQSFDRMRDNRESLKKNSKIGVLS